MQQRRQQVGTVNKVGVPNMRCHSSLSRDMLTLGASQQWRDFYECGRLLKERVTCPDTVKHNFGSLVLPCSHPVAFVSFLLPW
jgi:hypothetical protein